MKEGIILSSVLEVHVLDLWQSSARNKRHVFRMIRKHNVTSREMFTFLSDLPRNSAAGGNLNNNRLT